MRIALQPYPNFPTGSIVLRAWAWIDRLTSFDEKRRRALVEAHLDRCCETVD